jgi:anti-anti-sigma regulatory factor
MDRREVDRAVLELPCSRRDDRIDEVQQRVDTLLEAGPRALVIDMSHGDQLSSSTIAALVWVRRRAAERGVDLILGRADRGAADTLLRSGLFVSSGSTPTSREVSR